MAEFFTSSHGKPKLALHGYCYTQNRTENQRVYWRCDDRLCRGRAVSIGQNGTATQDHHHAPNTAEVKIKIQKSKMKSATDSTESTASIISRFIARPLHANPDSSLPKLNSLKRTIQRARCQHMPPLPLTTVDLKLEGRWRNTSTGEPWIIREVEVPDEDDNNQVHQMVILATIQNLKYLAAATVWYGDGTFSIVPSLFYQLYTIHAPVFGKIVPLVYALLPRKTYICYHEMMQTIRDAIDNRQLQLRLTTYCCDFEGACIRASRAVFGDGLIVQGCFFHLCQANYRQVVSLGLRNKYMSSEEFALDCKKITALAFVPANDICATFDELRATICNDAKPVAKYFERTYIGRQRTVMRGPRLAIVRKTPKFAPRMWSVYDRAVSDQPRTTNSLEGWHRRMGHIMGKTHPNIFEFLLRLCDEQCHTELTIQKLVAGDAVEPPRKRMRIVNDRISRVVAQYHERNTMDYVLGIAHNITYVL